MLEFVNIRKNFGGQTVLGGVNLTIGAGEFFSLLGPSGCGKTTLLRILAGFETADSGELKLDGARVDSLPPQKRPLNMVFQRYALFPHLDVRENVAFGLKVRGIAAPEIRRRVDRMLEMTGLADRASQRPETLSGGQQQRVALARALVNEPRVLLLDEPLSALDQKMREHMQTELRALQRRLGLTFVYVTHDQEEALTLSDRVAVMNQGGLEQVGTPRELYEQPRTAFVSSFIGRHNRLSVRVTAVEGEMMSVALDDGRSFRVKAQGFQTGERLLVDVRPEKMKMGGDGLRGRILQNLFKGGHGELLIDAKTGVPLRVLVPDVSGFTIGSECSLGFDPHDVRVFAAIESGKSLS